MLPLLHFAIAYFRTAVRSYSRLHAPELVSRFVNRARHVEGAVRAIEEPSSLVPAAWADTEATVDARKREASTVLT